MIKNIKIGITGLPGAGKTHALHKVIEMLEGEDKIIGGMITDPIIVKGERKGFKVMDWQTKEVKVFAHEGLESEIMVGDYGVDIEALESIGVPAITNATEESELIVIDEVGKMEVESPLFVEAVKEALDTDKPLILTLHKKSRNPLLQDIRRRDDVRILEVTPINRDLLPHKIIRLLKGEGELA